MVLKNVVGNWQATPIFTFQSPEYATVQSGIDSNCSVTRHPIGISSIRLAYQEPAAMPTSLRNSSGLIVGYLANNPTAQYIIAGSGALANANRNTEPRINNWDFSLLKRINITERQALEFNFEATNIFNHAQYVPAATSAMSLPSALQAVR